MTWMEWYDRLAKPSWTPAPATISLIWMVLYPIIVVTFGFVFVQAFRKKLPWLVALPFAINLIANLLFMPIFSGLRNVPLAAVDIVFVWKTLIWLMIVVWPVYKWVAVVQVTQFRLGVNCNRNSIVDHGNELRTPKDVAWIHLRTPVRPRNNRKRFWPSVGVAGRQ